MFLVLNVQTQTGPHSDRESWTCRVNVWLLCLAVDPAISHHSGYVMFAVHGQQTCEMNVNEADPSFSGITFIIKYMNPHKNSKT